MRPDVVIVVIDDVADSDVDAISAKGWTPNLDALKARGVCYRRAYAMALCAPTRDSLAHSRWLGRFRGDSCDGPIPGLTHTSHDYSLAEMMDGAGYSTAHIGKWHDGTAPFGPFELAPNLEGYDDALQTVFVGPECSALSPGPGQFRVDNGVGAVFFDDNTIACRDAFLAWWAATPSPRFAVVNFGAAHAPFEYPDSSILPPGYPRCGLSNCTNRKEFEAEVAGVDFALGEMLVAIGTDAYVVFLGDNGTPGIVPGEPQTGPAGTVATRANQDPSRVKLSCYEDGVRVPLIIAGPQIVHGESQALVHVIDLFPTLARMAGIKPLPDALIQGKSFATTLIGLPGQRQHVFVWNPDHGGSAIIERRWKLLTRMDGVQELYDLDLDPHESTPLPLSGPDYDRLSAKLAGILAGGA